MEQRPNQIMEQSIISTSYGTLIPTGQSRRTAKTLQASAGNIVERRRKEEILRDLRRHGGNRGSDSRTRRHIFLGDARSIARSLFLLFRFGAAEKAKARGGGGALSNKKILNIKTDDKIMVELNKMLTAPGVLGHVTRERSWPSKEGRTASNQSVGLIRAVCGSQLQSSRRHSFASRL
jgi:hypothetical protein